jgi:tetratricopeptide (TPR) repeat protein
MKKAPIIFLLAVALHLPGLAHAQAQSPQHILNQYVSDLQKNPNDQALREKIIRHVQTMRPAPAVPERAREHYVMAVTFAEKAKDNSGYERAIEQYRAALLAAPWWADAYKRSALTQKAAARYDDAIANLSLYVLTQPPDAREAQDEIYKLKALKQTAADDQLKKQKEEQQRDAPKILHRQLKARYEGATYSFSWCSYAGQSQCFRDTGKFPCGCNEAEYNGNSWYGRNDFVHTVSFPEDGTILFSYMWLGKSYISLRGTPKGATVNDMVWEQRAGEAGWRAAWVRVDGLDKITYSPNRPVSSALYSAAQRYDYTTLTRKR